MIAMTLRTQLEQQERMLATRTSSTNTAVGGLHSAVEQCVGDYDAIIGLITTSQKAKRRGGISKGTTTAGIVETDAANDCTSDYIARCVNRGRRRTASQTRGSLRP